MAGMISRQFFSLCRLKQVLNLFQPNSTRQIIPQLLW